MLVMRKYNLGRTKKYCSSEYFTICEYLTLKVLLMQYL